MGDAHPRTKKPGSSGYEIAREVCSNPLFFFRVSSLSEMCKRTKELLTSRITEVIQILAPSNPVMEEVTRHAIFCRDHTRSFKGRAKILQDVYKYLSSRDPMMPLVVHGESGVGKTSLMAKVVEETQDNNKDKNGAILYRFCGTTPDSSTGMLSIIQATVEG